MTDIRKEDLIDVNDNKPIEEVEPTDTKPQTEQETIEEESVIDVPLKNVSKLTKDERNILIEQAKQGIENANYKVVFCKNGNTKITKRKQNQTVSQQFINNKSSMLTNEQLLMEHVINLEAQIATMKQKQKRLKKSYKQMYQDVYIDDDTIGYGEQQQPQQQPQTINEQKQNDNTNHDTSYGTEQQARSYIPKMRTGGWRQRLINNYYIH